MTAAAPPRSSFSPTDVARFVVLSGIWGFSFLFIKVLVAAMAPLWVVAGRTLFGAAVLLAVLSLTGRRLPADGQVWRHLLILAVVTNVVPWTLIAWAEESIPSGLASVLNALTPVATLGIAAAIGVEQLTRARVVGLGLALVGVAVVASGEAAAPERLLGVVIAVGATVFYAAGAVYAKRHVGGLHPTVVAAGQVTASATLALPAALLLAPGPDLGALDAGIWAAWLTLGALGTGVAYLLFYWLLSDVGPTNTTMVTYVVPLVGVVAGWVFLHERLGLHVLAGGATIIAGIYVAQRRPLVCDVNAPAELDVSVTEDARR